MNKKRVWPFFVIIKDGIFQGSIEGEQEEGETDEEAFGVAAETARTQMEGELGAANVLAIIMVDGMAAIYAPRTELINLDFEKNIKSSE